MFQRVNRLVFGSRNSAFLVIFLTTFIYKFFLGWRSGIDRGWQDELGWRTFARDSTFVETISEYDAGYPTPFLRAISFVLSNLSNGSFITWHLATLILLSASVASLAFTRVISLQSSFVIALLVASYPSFDLLLLHNLSYWIFIPLFVISTNLIYQKIEINGPSLALFVMLALVAAKPQILGAILVFSIAIASRKEGRRKSIILLFPILFFLAAGRLSDDRLSLNIDIQSIGNLILTLPAHFVAATSPLFTISFFAASKIIGSLIIILIFYFFANSLAITYALKSNNSTKPSRQDIAQFLALLVYLSSLYFFPNSGWSQNDLLISDIYTKLFTRHYLPVILSTCFLLVTLSKRKNLINLWFSLAIVQYAAMQMFLFETFYRPV
jgi:hypothetical protein